MAIARPNTPAPAVPCAAVCKGIRHRDHRQHRLSERSVDPMVPMPGACKNAREGPSRRLTLGQNVESASASTLINTSWYDTQVAWRLSPKHESPTVEAPVFPVPGLRFAQVGGPSWRRFLESKSLPNLDLVEAVAQLAGTDGSKPFPSSEESCELRYRRRDAPLRQQPGEPTRCARSQGLVSGDCPLRCE
jgi:hypothetical protein